jgi:protein subunit release factor B
MFPVSPEKANALRARMARLGIRDADLDEQFIRSGGHGGQNVNKVATCVVLVHLPSGVRVRCQQERTQGMNRFFARRELCNKIEAREQGAKDAAAATRARIRRQKRRRSKRADEKRLAAKRDRGETKTARRSPSDEG